MGILKSRTIWKDNIKNDMWELKTDHSTYWIFVNSELLGANRSFNTARKRIFSETGVRILPMWVK